jgi:hypothetical protein
MSAWIRNAPVTWKNLSGWRTDIPLTVLSGELYDFAEYHLEDGKVLEIPMSEMRRALLEFKKAPIRANLMVGPFNIDPIEKTVYRVYVQMSVAR